ncbi:MAG TPA: hypothetical protein VMV79_07625 [Alphaproteobacteria bacterium]|nr:hypothetical protein [Alphaproteobacteria bacterium]
MRAKTSSFFPIPVAILMAALALGAPGGPAWAEDQPFQFEPTGWMSFNRYKEDPSAWKPPQPAPAVKPPILATAVVPPPVAPAVLQEPLRTPAMPGLNNGFDIRVSSTASGAPLNPDGLLPLGMPDNNWQNAAAAARLLAERKMLAEAHAGPPEIPFTALPDPGVLPSYDLPHTPKPKPRVAETPMPSAREKAACAAIDAYKKRQLEAIKSDQQTLAALQGAIKKLGLQKKLDFLVDNSGNPVAASTVGKINDPAPAKK